MFNKNNVMEITQPGIDSHMSLFNVLFIEEEYTYLSNSFNEE